MEVWAAGSTMSDQISVAEERVKSIKARLSNTQLALEKLTDESSRTKAQLRAELSVVGESLKVEKKCVERLKR